MSASFSLTPGFHAVVVGGAGDIGAAISNQFCDLGATVTATGVDDADLARSLLKPRTGLALTTLDVTSDEAVASLAGQHQTRRCADQLRRHSGAGQGIRDRDLHESARRQSHRHVSDLHGVSPLLAKSNGSIVNIASMNATLALPRIPAYCASKGGVVMLTKALALAWAEDGIRVNAVRTRLCRNRDQCRRPHRPRPLSAHRRPHRLQALGTARGHRRCRRLPLHASLAIRDRNGGRGGWRVSGGVVAGAAAGAPGCR